MLISPVRIAHTIVYSYVDLLLLHWECDTLENTVLTYQAMEASLAAGTTRAIGTPGFATADLPIVALTCSAHHRCFQFQRQYA